MPERFAEAPVPATPRRPVAREGHGLRWTDPYAWLRDGAPGALEAASIRQHLEAENAYAEAVLAPLSPLKNRLRETLEARLDPQEQGVPWTSRAGTFRWAYDAEDQYPKWYRLEGEAAELVLDEPALAADAEAFSLGAFAPSPAGTYLAFAYDRSGAEHYTLAFRPLAGGQEEWVTDQSNGDVVWAQDESGFFYLVQNDQWRPFQLRWHRRGTDPVADPVLYEERDPGFFLSLSESVDGAFVLLTAGDHQTQGVWVLSLAGPPETPLRCLVPPLAGREVDVDHAHGHFWLRSNHEHPNFGLYRLASAGPWEDAPWVTLQAPQDAVYLVGVTLFATFWARLERLEARDRIMVAPISGSGQPEGAGEEIVFPSELGQAGFGTNAAYEAEVVRVAFSSMIDPPAVYDYDPGTRRLTFLKQRVVPGYQREDFEQRRFWARSADGTAVPYTLARRKGAAARGVHLYGYGAYGLGEMPGFSSARLLLLEAGVTCVLAHVRGGDELGQAWYRAATGLGRERTFEDFLAVSEALIAEGWAAPGQIALEGGSAGGELVAVALNRAPGRWAGVYAAVPFVDVLHTMMDPTLPLTPLEWPEWGNPLESTEAFEAIRAYCPYQNVKAGAYPPVLATAGVEDPRVGYWEPAKWIAALRNAQQGSAPLLLRTQFKAGHGGATGRYGGLEEVAEAYAFLLTVLGHAGSDEHL